MPREDTPGAGRLVASHRTTSAADAAPLYQTTCEDLGWTPDAGRLSSMQAENKKQLEEMDAKAKDAEENLGDIEVKNALASKADYLCEIGGHCRLVFLQSSLRRRKSCGRSPEGAPHVVASGSYDVSCIAVCAAPHLREAATQTQSGLTCCDDLQVTGKQPRQLTR